MKPNKVLAEVGASSARPKYQRIRDHFSAEIRSGRLAPGQSLPTEAELVESLGISRYTIRQALAELQDDGIISRVPGRGTFVTSEQQRSAQQQQDVFAFIAPTLEMGPYPALLQGFEQACADCRHQTVVGNSGNEVGRQADLIIQMVQRSIGGLALVPTTTPTTPVHQIKLLQDSRIPVVLCHRTVPGATAPAVVYNGREIGRTAGQALVELGHRRIAFLTCHRYPLSDEYLQGLRDALVDRGFDPAGVEVVEYGSTLVVPDREAASAIAKLVTQRFDRADRPTAVFCGNGPDAEVAYMQIEAAGLKIPHDLSLIHIGTTTRQHGLAGKISCVAVHERELGMRAAQLLHEMRLGKRAIDDNEQFECECSIIPGETIGPVSQQSG